MNCRNVGLGDNFCQSARLSTRSRELLESIPRQEINQDRYRSKNIAKAYRIGEAFLLSTIA